MAITRYNPWVEMNALQNQLNRVFEDIQAPAFRTPAAELTETEDALHLRLELPGIEAKDVDIEVTADAVKVIAGNHSHPPSQQPRHEAAGIGGNKFPLRASRTTVAI